MSTAKQSEAGTQTWYRLAASHLPFVLLVGALAVAATPGALRGLPGAGQITRNTETLVMALTPWYWLLFASERDIGQRRPAPPPRHQGAQLAWILGWFTVAVLLQAMALGALDWGLPQSVVTLGEGALTVAVVSAWLGVTRGVLVRSRTSAPDGNSFGARRGLYLLLVVLAVLVLDAQTKDPVQPSFLAEFLRLNIEAVAGVALLLVSLDLVLANRPGFGRVGVWCLTMLAVPVLIRVPPLETWLPAGLVDWLGRGIEAFLAAALVTAWGWLHRQYVYSQR